MSNRDKRWVRYVAALVLVSGILFAWCSPVAAADDPPPSGGGPNQLVAVVKKIAAIAINTIIGIIVALSGVGIATGFLGGQFLVTVGQPLGLSQAWMRVIAIIILTLGGVMSMVIVNTVIDAVTGLIPDGTIPDSPVNVSSLFLWLRVSLQPVGQCDLGV
jgi:hypothetical protein